MLAVCGGSPAPPAPTKVSEAKHLLADPPRTPRDPNTPFRRPDREKPLPRSEPQIPADQIDAALAAASDAKARGQSFEAALALWPCANKVPQHVRCEGELGLVLLEFPQRAAEASYYLEQAVAADDPTADADFYRRLGDGLRKVPLAYEASVAYQRMIARLPAPASADWALLAATLQGVPGRDEEAAAALHRAFELDPQQLDLLRDEALLLAQIEERRAEALALLTRYRDSVAEIAPDKAQAASRQIVTLQVDLEKNPPAAPAAPAAPAPGGGQQRRKPAAPTGTRE